MSERTKNDPKEAYANGQWRLLRPKPSTPKGDNGAVTAWMQPDEIKQLEAIASALGMSRSEFLRASFIANRDAAITAGVIGENVATPA